MNKIAAAFVKAQKNFAPALKQSVNPHFKSKYVDLAGCVEAVIDALNNEGIALIQNTHESDTGVMVETVFMHESGETLSCGKLHVPAAKQDPQGYGSALTYARRYSLMAACGIAPEDDDGNAASKKKPEPHPASGAGTKKEAYDSLKPHYREWIDKLAEHVNAEPDYEESHAYIEDKIASAERIASDPQNKYYDPEFDPAIYKMGLWWKLDSKVRTAIDGVQKGLRKAA